MPDRVSFRPVTIPPDARIQANDPLTQLQRGDMQFQHLPDPEAGGLIGMMPEPGPGWLNSLAKDVGDIMGAVFKPTVRGGGLPSRLRFTNWNGRTGMIQMHDIPTNQPYEIAPKDFDSLVNSGVLELEQPPANKALQKALEAKLGPPREITKGKSPMRDTLDSTSADYRASQFKRNASK